MRIAIVGSGISGLVAAHHLHRHHDITVFEAEAYAGGHTHTVRVDLADETHEIDTGFIVFNDRNYPNFERLLIELGVGWQTSDMSFSVSDDAGAFEYASASPNAVFAQRSHLGDPRFLHMLAELRRFQRAAGALVADAEEHRSLGQWLQDGGYSQYFIDRLIVPQVAAVWSAEPRLLWSFPVRFMAEFFANHGMLDLRHRPTWRVVRGGSHRYVEALSRPFADRIRLDCPVEKIRRADTHVSITPEGGAAEVFDHVVVATHSDQALRLLGDATPAEREILGAIPYARNDVVLHTDGHLLPRRRRAWASWNYHLTGGGDGPAKVTYHMNRLQSLQSRHQLLVTLNRPEAIDPAHVIRRFEYYHPIYTPAGVQAQSRVEEISGRNRTHYCGAYWSWGFHEDGVRSGLRVVDEIGAAA